jgi:WD40 repeat protein
MAAIPFEGNDLKRAESASRIQLEPRLSPRQIEYIRASRRAANRRLSLAATIGATALIVISALGLLSWLKDRESNVNRAAELHEKGVTALEAKNSLSAEVLFARALTINDTEETRGRLLQARAKSPSLVWTRSYSGDGSVLAISHNGNFLAIGARDEVQIWSTEAGEIVRSFRLQSPPQVAAFSPDGKFLATSSDQTIQVWSLDADARDLGWQVPKPEDMSSLAFSPDDRFLISGSKGGSLWVWDMADEQPQPRKLSSGHVGQITSMVVSRDGRSLIFSSFDDTIKIWNLVKGKRELALAGHEDEVACVTLSPDGETIASGGWDDIIWIWDFRTGKKLRALRGHKGNVRSLAFSPDGKWLASGSEDQTTK